MCYVFPPQPIDKPRYYSQGHGLIEMAIVLVIMGVLMSGFMSLFQHMQRASKNTLTQQRIEKAVYAISHFYQRYGHIPCPAPSSCEHGGVAPQKCTTNNNRIGIIPFHTLGISSDSAKDAYGHFLTYVVDDAYAHHHLPEWEDHKKGDPITLLDTFHKNITPTHNPIIILIIDHGKRGDGAFIGSSSFGQRYPAYTPEDKRNLEEDMHFYEKPPHLKVYAISESDFLYHYGASPKPSSSSPPPSSSEPVSEQEGFEDWD